MDVTTLNGFSGPTVTFFAPAFNGKFLTWVQGEDRLTGRINYTDRQFEVGGRNLADVLDTALNFNIVAISFKEVVVPALIYQDTDECETDDEMEYSC